MSEPVSDTRVSPAGLSDVFDTVRRMGHLYGYTRVSTSEQDAAAQADALTAAGCARLFQDVASGTRDDRPELAKLLATVLPGDTVVVWRLDRFGRSLRHLIDTITDLEQRGVGFRSLQESIDTTTTGGRLVFHLFGALAQFSVISTRRVSYVPAVGAAA